MMRRRIFILIFLVFTLGIQVVLPAPSKAQSEVQILDPQADYTFGVQASFQATILAGQRLQEVVVFVQTGGPEEVLVIPATIDDQGKASSFLNLIQNPLRAFTLIPFWFQATLQDGTVYTSDALSFYYEDNRFAWKNLKNQPFIVFWHAGGDVTFAQEVLNVASAGYLQALDYLQVIPPAEVKIYVYDNAQEMQQAHLLSTQKWVAGHADPDLGIILVSLPPGPEQHLEMERQIPHELMHVALYNTQPFTYDQLPAWFIEGLASITELYPNPDYQSIMEAAYREERLLSIAALCRAFPNDANQALLAYAEAASFMGFLFNRFGSDGFSKMMAAYSFGVGCEQGVERALGKSLAGLEIDWRAETFAENVWQNAFADLSPWLLLLLIALIGPLLMFILYLRKKPARMGI